MARGRRRWRAGSIAWESTRSLRRLRAIYAVYALSTPSTRKLRRLRAICAAPVRYLRYLRPAESLRLQIQATQAHYVGPGISAMAHIGNWGARRLHQVGIPSPHTLG